METTPFVIERVFNTPAAAVWEAITDKNKMKEWYFDLAEFKAEPGFEFSFYGGDETTQYLHLCKVTEVIPGKKLTYSWRYEDKPGNSFVTFELLPEGNKTRVKLTHTGLETFTTDDKNFAPGSFAKGWTFIIGESLKNYLEKE